MVQQALETVLIQTGRILLSYFRRNDLKQEHKTVRDMVSEADRHAEQFLMEKLTVIDSCLFLGEEFNPNEPLLDKPLWIIDPLDGTSNFIAGFPVFAISVAHWNGHCVDLAACYLPVTKEFFFAEKGKGAYENGTKLQVSATSEPIEATVACGFADVVKALPRNTLAVFSNMMPKVRAIRRPGSAVTDLCYTARGTFDFFWELGLSPWDVAAGSLLVQEAGGLITDFSGGTNYLTGGSIIASNKPLYPFAKKEIEAHFGTL